MTTPAQAQNVKGKGRHYPNPATGDLVPSVTNVLSMLNKPALVGWAAREVATLAADLRGSLAAMEHGEVVTLLKGAATRRGNKAATRGTDIHTYIESRLGRCEPAPLDRNAEPYRAAADAWIENYVSDVHGTEITMFAPGYAGTADSVIDCGGRTTLVDIKTSKAIYPEASLQLAALAAGTIWHEGSTPMEPVPIDDLAVVRIGLDGEYEIGYVADAERALETFHALLTVWHWHHTSDHYKEPADVATV